MIGFGGFVSGANEPDTRPSSCCASNANPMPAEQNPERCPQSGACTDCLCCLSGDHRESHSVPFIATNVAPSKLLAFPSNDVYLYVAPRAAPPEKIRVKQRGILSPPTPAVRAYLSSWQL
jgi:hypothetical protein